MKALDETMNAKSLFGRRLRILLAEKNMNQRELAEVLGVTESTVGKWTLGKSMPRTMGIIQTIADYFHVNKSYLLDEKADKNGLISISLSADTSRNMRPSYYDDPEVAAIANELKNNPDMRVLFDASRHLSKQDIQTVAALVKSLSQKGGD